MESGRTDRWMSSPILVGTAKNGGYLDVFSVEPSESDAKVDKTPEPKDIWELYGATAYRILCIVYPPTGHSYSKLSSTYLKPNFD